MQCSMSHALFDAARFTARCVRAVGQDIVGRWFRSPGTMGMSGAELAIFCG